MRRLLLLRHAKAEQAKKDTPEDRGRALTQQGRANATRVGYFMQMRGYVPDLILCSPSKRTRETLALVTLEIGGKAHVEFPAGLYLATARQLLTIVRELPEESRCPLLIGHNPGLEECLTALSGGSADQHLRTKFGATKEKFPTCALAVLEFKSLTWNGVDQGSGTLLEFVRPKDLPAS